ncbi:M16 family metallopeptidase [Candidatus Nucleicultrix amoebiphila]|jgi:predicted Zn-dependent peptidase|uniref:M16 family metallopeptidase n=1 Tax=Candidatus Nucleicultrix amoebiphila TaxID=1509244 RepID=UPI000A26FBE3|nr:pitrilysin family protein [Candidatus Nucleicultrix amoebiphila]
MTTRISTLANGLKIVTDTLDSVETAAIGVWVNVGTRNEKTEINGISHFLEHMAFKGTTKHSAKQIAERIESLGGHLNAYTSRESTAYYARILAENLPTAVDTLADILQFSVFNSDELERERAVILQEIGQTYDTPDDIIFDYFQGTAFPDQPLGRPILGSIEVVNSLTRETIKDYMQHAYAASRMTLVAAGKVDHDALVAMAEEKFQHLPHESIVEVAPAKYVGNDFRQARELEQVHVVLGFPGVALGGHDYYTAAVLSTLFGGGMSSRLFQEVREKRGLVYSICAFASSYSDAGLFGVYAGTGANEVKELIPVVIDEINRLPDSLKEEEVQRAKVQLKAGLMMALESTSARSEQLANQMTVYGRPLAIAEIIDRIEAVNVQNAAALARSIFANKPTFAALGPIQNVESYDCIQTRLGKDSLKQKIAI